jgi:AcrR family transcriptional regulator
MSRAVKPRSYDSSQRQEASAATRRRILDAARSHFISAGYRRTTVAAIARAAAVNVDTLYELVGRKPALMRELIEEALSGTDHPIAAEQRRYVHEIRAATDARTKLRIYAHAVRAIQERLAPLFIALRDAALTEPEAASLWQEISERRARNMRLFVDDVRRSGGLRAGVTPAIAADTVWLMNSSDVYVLLCVERGWPPARYERWLFETWSRLLLPDA